MLTTLDPKRLATDSSAARQQLSRVAGKLKMHLELEDKCLYPELFKHSDAKVRDLAKQYQREMGNIFPVFEAYLGKWSSAQLIQGKPDAFIRETKEIVKVLDDRIRRENTELYRLADAVG